MKSCEKIAIVVVILITLMTIVVDSVWKVNLERSVRQQARYNLQQIKSCMNDLLLTDKFVRYKPLKIEITNDDVERALKTCARDMKTSATGDVFAFDLKSLNFVFDPSLDCYVEGGKQMTKESECSIHQNPKLCEQAMTKLSSGVDSDQDTFAYWEFNSGKEYLEFIVLPDKQIGYDGNMRGGNVKPHQIVVAQGSQEDELHNRYLITRMAVFLSGLIVILITLIITLSHRENDG